MKKLLLFTLLTFSISVISQTRTKIAFLSDAASVATITEPDTQAAASLTETTYGADFKYLQASTMITSDFDDVATVFFYFDNTGSFDLPGGGSLSAGQITMLSDFVQAGGSILLAGFATRYIDDIGRITYEPGIAGNGGGGANDDNWGINFGPTGMPQDVTGHASFVGITSTDVINPVTMATLGHSFMPLISTGHKEDHNSMWDLGAIGDLTEPHASVARGAEFETLTTSTILGTWQHVADMCCVAAAEFHPSGAYTGTIIAVGAAAYEFSMADNAGATNPWQGNVDLFTTNTLNYLKALTQALSVEEVQLNAITVYPNPVKNDLYITKRNEDKLSLNLYDINGRLLLKNVIIDNNPINITALNSGVFFAEIKDENNKTLKTVKVLKN